MDKELREQIIIDAEKMSNLFNEENRKCDISQVTHCTCWESLAKWHLQRTLEARVDERNRVLSTYKDVKYDPRMDALTDKLQQLKDG